MNKMRVAVLFARADSTYKKIPYCDVWDVDRDATKYPGPYPVVAHPPCRAWGNLAKFAKPRPGERDLAFWAVEQVRKYGGVLEHPRTSKLWVEAGLPLAKSRDIFGGWSICVDQCWWGHKARKSTLLYLCGVEPGDIPQIPLNFAPPTHEVAGKGSRRGKLPGLGKAAREHTPPDFARWLVEAAALCRPGG